MKKQFLIYLFATLFILSGTQAQKTLLNEDFNKTNKDWLYYNGKVTFLFYNGKLIFANTDSLNYNLTMPVTIEDGKNFSITTTATHTDGKDNYGYGIYFGSSDISNCYKFFITSNGYFCLTKNTPTEYTEIIKWTQSAALKKGNYVENILKVSRKDGNWLIEANDLTLGRIPAMPFFGNKAGFCLSNAQRVEFDDVKVTQK